MWRKTKAPRKKPAAARILRRILMAAKPVSADKAPPQAPAVNGWIIIDKPLGLTSTQVVGRVRRVLKPRKIGHGGTRSEEHTSELQSLMRISYAVFCLKKKKTS